MFYRNICRTGILNHLSSMSLGPHPCSWFLLSLWSLVQCSLHWRLSISSGWLYAFRDAFLLTLIAVHRTLPPWRIDGDTKVAPLKPVQLVFNYSLKGSVHLSERKEKISFILRTCVHLTDSSQMEEVHNTSDFKYQSLQVFLLKAVGRKHFSCLKELWNFIGSFKKHSVVVLHIWHIDPINLTKYIPLRKLGQYKCFKSKINKKTHLVMIK